MELLDQLRLAIAARLERGQGLPWQADPSPLRRVRLPARALTIGVGGALLGGSGRTPLALAIAAWCAPRGRIALISHGYGGRARAPTRVSAAHGVADVGDEAALAFERLRPLGVAVWSGPRQATLHAAAAESDVLVLDGLLQTTPKPLTLSLLALSGEAPWGSARVWPRGDLRATRARLQDACDAQVWLRDEQDADAWSARTRLTLPTDAPSARESVLVLAEARSDRLLGALTARGHHFAHIVRLPDHHAHRAPLPRCLRDARAVFASEKGAVGLRGRLRCPLFPVRLEVALPAALEDVLAALLP